MSPATSARNDARARILEAADRLYYRRGIQSVGMDELRAAAEVSLKRLYAEFPSKEQVVLAVLDARHARWSREIAARVDPAVDPRSALLAIYDYLAEWFSDEDYRGCAFINAFGELGGTLPAVAIRARAHKRSFQRVVAGLVARLGVDPELAAQLTLLAEGAQTTSAITGDPEAATQARHAAEVLITAAQAAARTASAGSTA